MSEGRDMGILGPEEMGICNKCNKRKATSRWADDATAAMLGGIWISYVCEICALEAQLKHANERADEIPTMEARLKELLEAENEGT